MVGMISTPVHRVERMIRHHAARSSRQPPNKHVPKPTTVTYLYLVFMHGILSTQYVVINPNGQDLTYRTYYHVLSVGLTNYQLL